MRFVQEGDIRSLGQIQGLGSLSEGLVELEGLFLLLFLVKQPELVGIEDSCGHFVELGVDPVAGDALFVESTRGFSADQGLGGQLEVEAEGLLRKDGGPSRSACDEADNDGSKGEELGGHIGMDWF